MADGAFTDISDVQRQPALPAVQPTDTDAIPGHLHGIARTVVSMTDVRATMLERHLIAALEFAPNKAFQDTQDARIRAAKRQLGLAFVGALEKLCSTNQPLEAERWAKALRTQFLLGELELLQVDCLNQLAMLYYARNQHKRALKAVKAALKLCSRLEQLGIMTAASAATRRAALHLNSSDTLSRLKRHDEALHSANSALQLLDPLADTSVEEKMGAELRISAMHSVGIHRQNTGDLHGATTMLAQTMQVANAKLTSDHALRKAVKRSAKLVNRPEWDASMSSGASSRPPKVLPAIKKKPGTEIKGKQLAVAEAEQEQHRKAAEQAAAQEAAVAKANQEEAAAAAKAKEEEETAVAKAKQEEETAAAAAAKVKAEEEAAAAKAKEEEQAAAAAAAAVKAKEEEEAAAAKAKQEEQAAAAAAAKAKEEEEAAAAAAAAVAAAAAKAKQEEEAIAARAKEEEEAAASKAKAEAEAKAKAAAEARAREERLEEQKAERERLQAEKAEQERQEREAEAKRLAEEAQKRSFAEAAAAAKQEREEAEAKAKAEAEAAAAARAAEEAAAADAEQKRKDFEAALKAADEAEQRRLEEAEAARIEEAEEQQRWLEQDRKRAEAAALAAKQAEEVSKAKGQLRITIMECKGIKEMDSGSHSRGTTKLESWGKKTDAYVICRVSEDVFQRTKTIDEGGSNPVWNGGKGEEMLFEVDAAETAGKIRLECMDDDSDEIVKKTGEVKEDEFIGCAELHFDNAPAGKKWKLDQWVEITDEKDKVGGEIHLIVRWAPPGVAFKNAIASDP